jgi:hypothetical protein
MNINSANIEFETRLNDAVAAAQKEGISINASSNKVNISYDQNYPPTKRAANILKDRLVELGFSCTWSNYLIDGEDEEWTR